jgi:hypothetical protein
MLLVHWSKHNHTEKILKSGIRPSRKSISESQFIKGVWCFPFSRNKTLNAGWKSLLKRDRGSVNYNGFVFRLDKEDFPIYAGDFGIISMQPEARKFRSYDEFVSRYGHYFSPKTMSLESAKDKGPEPDYGDFEIILSKAVAPERIIKLLKDRPSREKP